jgi:hypothetical protein
VWASDETTKGFDVTGLEVLQDDIVIVPMNRPGSGGNAVNFAGG